MLVLVPSGGKLITAILTIKQNQPSKMLNFKFGSHSEIKLKIKEAIQFMEPDLDIVTKNGAIIRANKLLLSLSSPLLQNLLTGEESSPDRIHLPDVSALALIHLINVVKNGFTTGLGPGYSLLKEIRDVAEVLGFQDIPVLTFEVQRNNHEVVEDVQQNAPVGSHEGGDDGIMDNMDVSNDTEPWDNLDEDQNEGVNGIIDYEDTSIEPGLPKTVVKPLVSQPLDHTKKACKATCSRKRKECVIMEDRLSRSQEVTEAIAKVLKIEPGQEEGDQNQNTGDVPMFPCVECSKRFSNAGSLVAHSDQHGEKTAKKKCPLCHFSGTRTHLLSHIRAKHTHEKLFRCAFCQQLFTSCATKKQHEKIHTRS